jgi:hypothetical protein
MTSDELREEAAKCRRLASGITDAQVEATLRQMATECDLKADALASAALPLPSQVPGPSAR